MHKVKHNLELILKLALEKGPKIVEKLNVRLQLQEAEDLCATLRKLRRDVQPYDFPYTVDVWQSNNSLGIPYKRLATKEFVRKIAEDLGVDYTTVEGFRELLPYFKIKYFRRKKINRWGTTLSGMISHGYPNSPYEAINDLISHDPQFASIISVGLQQYDLPVSPQNTWFDKKGKPTNLPRTAVKELVMTLAGEKKLDYRKPEGFVTLLPYLNADSFKYKPINVWGTTLQGCFSKVYGSSTKTVIRDLLEHDPEFSEVVAHLRKIRPYMPGIMPRRIYYK